MSRFDSLKASTVADLMARGFHLVDSEHFVRGSMLPVEKFTELRECFVYKTGSIANFTEMFITWVSYDEDEEDNIISICIHDFAESGEWFVDHESLVYKHVPEKNISEFLRQKGLLTREEWQAREEERRAKMRKRA